MSTSCRLCLTLRSLQLDFEDEPPDDEESGEEEEEERDDEDEEEESDNEAAFHDAMDNLTIADEAPKPVAVSA
jgi:diphthamide biosynthesis protein 3